LNIPDFTGLLRTSLSLLTPLKLGEPLVAGAFLGGALVGISSALGIATSAPPWSIVSLGCAVILVPWVLLGRHKPATTWRDELKVLDEAMNAGGLSPTERRQHYRKVVEDLVARMARDPGRRGGKKATRETA
jgi:hypothetical protein